MDIKMNDHSIIKRFMGIKVLLIVLMLILASIIIGIYWKYNSREKILREILVSDEKTYHTQDVQSKEIQYKIVEKKKLNISNIYLNEDKEQIQIRLQVNYSIPFQHPDFFRETEFILKDSLGNDLTPYITAYSDSFLGRNGISMIFIFSKENDLPKSGEDLLLTISAKENGSEEKYAFGEIQISIP